MSAVVVVGWLAAVTATLLGVPQAIRLVRTGETAGLSLLAWQAILGINIAWTSHGFLIGAINMIVPNSLALTSTLPVLYLMAKDLRIPLWRVFSPGLAIAATMIAVDLLFGSAVFGLLAIVPSMMANAGQSVELVRAPHIDGVSPVFLLAQLLNQTLWLTWAVLAPDQGTIITAGVTLAVATFNVSWWLWRYVSRPRPVES